MAAEAINKDADELLNIAVEKLLSIASALSNDGATSVNHRREFGVESEWVLSKEPLPKAVEASNDEGARFSITQQELSIQKSEVRPFAGYDDIVPGMLVTNAIQGLLFGIEYFGTSKVDAISRGVFNVAETLAVRSGKEEDIVMYLEPVLEYLETTPELAGTLLHCHILYRFVKVFEHKGLMENAKRALYSAQRIAVGRSNMAHLEMAILASLINIHKELGEDQLLHIARITFIQICEARLMSTSVWPDGIEYTSVLEAVGRTCFEIGLACSDMERIGDGINYMTEALRVEADQENETPRQAMRQASLLLQLSECYYQHPELSTGQLACLILLDQAIAGFQQVECTCSPDSIDPLASNWGGTGVIECGRHQKLADAFKSLGIVQENQGFMKEAQKSFERGLDLVEECNDVGRIAEFRLVLAVNLFLRSHLNFAFGLPRLEETPELTKFHYKHIFDHFTEFLRITRPGASFERDQLAIYARALLNPPEDLNEGTLEKVMALRKMLENAEKRGSRSGHAFHHQSLSVHYLRLNDVEACKHHLSLALKSLEETPSTTEISLQVLQPLGWIAMDPEIRDFDCAYGIWQKVYRATAETLENLAQISEEHAFRYFEISKHACVALAKCQMYRAKFSKENEQQLAESALIWAERGKGRTLMSFIDASTRCNADPASHFDKGRFLTDDTFALKFICNSLPTSPALIISQARKTVFVEYTFIDYMSLMIQIVIDGPGSVSTLHYSGIISLHNILSEVTRHEAETYLNAVQNSSEAMQNSANTVTFQGEIQNVLSAMNKYSTNRIPFNPWIPGIVVGIQKHIGEAIAKLSLNRNSLVDKEMNKIAELLQALYAVLIKPIKEELAAVYEQGRDTLVFVPHEDLGIVPFAALHESEESPRYLIEDYAISVSPSIWCTRHCQYLYEKIVRSGCEEGAVPVLVGKKSGYPPEYQDLRQAHKEVDAVAEAIGQSSSMMVLKDDNLSHARNLMEVLPNASWIHLCVHGEVSSQFPQGSLLFSDNGSQRLTAEEIMTVAPSAWRARAVVLSACQTGLGSVAGGGIMEFARSFILAGVPSSVLSMWQAEERFSTEFMQKLYKQLASGYTLAYAVQEVIKSMMHEYKKGRRIYRELKWSILHWACFSCLGFPSVVLPNTEERTDGTS